MKSSISPVIIALLAPCVACADEFTEKFAALKEAADGEAIEDFLEKAATEQADNANYYATASNYWWGIANSLTVPALKAGSFELDPKDLTIRDPETGEKVGAIGKGGAGGAALRTKVVDLLSEGAGKFPGRADIALGLAHVQREMGKPEDYTKTLLALLSAAKEDAGALRWTDDGALPEPVDRFIPESVHPYSAALFNANSPATDTLCAKLLGAMVDTFPDHPYAYNLAAALADAKGKPEEALGMLETALEKAPEDNLIRLNLAGAYAKAGKTKEAEAAYKKVLDSTDDPKSRQKAQAGLDKLK